MKFAENSEYVVQIGRRRFLVGGLGAALTAAGMLAASRTASATTPPVSGTIPAPGGTAYAGPSKSLKVFGAYATAIEEPWDGVIHAALQGIPNVEYTFNDKLGYSGDMERVLREVCETEKPNIIFGDAFGNEDPVRAVALEYPDIAFVFGSGGGPAEPNVSVFDNWIHEPAYLAGMLAGGVTKSGVLGVVGGLPVPEVNRIINAFVAGAQKSKPDVAVKVTFINSWFDPAAAKEAALAQVDAGADVLFAERAGVIEAAAGEGSRGHRQHERPVLHRSRHRADQLRVDHDAHRRLRAEAGRRRGLQRPGPQGLLDDGQGRSVVGAHQHQAGPRRADQGGDRYRGVDPLRFVPRRHLRGPAGRLGGECHQLTPSRRYASTGSRSGTGSSSPTITCRCTCTAARFSACSARTAPASPP
ncbi:MAG: BMP family protein [Ilumatobacteraceae bacterium]